MAGDDADEAPHPAAAWKWRSTRAEQLCRRVLSTVSAVDDAASIASVSRWDHDQATLVRVRAGGCASDGGGAPFRIVDALRHAWPLAVVSLVENVIEGTTEAQMLVPSRAEQRELARQQALASRGARRLRLVAKVAALAAMLSFVVLATANAAR